MYYPERVWADDHFPSMIRTVGLPIASFISRAHPSMSPKRPIRAKDTASHDSPPTSRIPAPDLLPGPRIHADGHNALPLPDHRSDRSVHLPEPQPPTVEIIDLPGDTQITRLNVEPPMSTYFLAPRLVDRLPQPDVQTGLRSSGRYHYVDLIDGATVLVGTDTQNRIRARLPNELIASGPLLERIEGTVQWRQVQAQSGTGAEPSQLILTRHLQDESPAIPEKRARREEDIGPESEGTPAVEKDDATATVPRSPAPLPDAPIDHWEQWAIDAPPGTTHDIQINGKRYMVLPQGPAEDTPIVYITNPTHLIHNYSSLERVLASDLLQQPRGAIRVPPAGHWEIDPTLPFLQPLAGYVAVHFPELSATCLQQVAKRQFELANGSDRITGTGLTLLRQTFNDWKAGNTYPRAELADPLLMLPSIITLEPENARFMALPLPDGEGSLQRLDFDPNRFKLEWSHFMPSQSGQDLKRFTAALLKRNGYNVFDISPSTSFPAVVFNRPGHDFLFFLSLHRIRGQKIHLPLNLDPKSWGVSLGEQVGTSAAQAVIQANAEKRVVWLRGGPQTLATYPQTFVIVRDENSRL